MLSDFDLGYVCGLIDGEGYIGFVSTQRGKNQPQYVAPRLTVTNKDISVLEWLKQTLGIGGIASNIYPRGDGAYTFYVGKRCDLEPLLETVASHLKIKKKQALLMLNFLRSRRELHAVGRGCHVAYVARELEIWKEVKGLNGRKGKHWLKEG